MKRDLLDAVGNIDEQFIEEASGRVLKEKKRTAWPLLAAVLALAILTASGLFALRKALHRSGKPNGPASDPAASGQENVGPAESGYNALDVDFDAAAARANDETFTAACRYAQQQTPSAKNDMTGLFAGKNLILITAQNFCPQVIDPERTPTLYRLATQGIEFTDYYQPMWGGATLSGEFAILTGLAPAHGVQSILDTVGKAMPFTLGNQLRSQGWFSRAYTDDIGYDTNRRDETHPNLGYESLLGVGNGLEIVLTDQWPRSDQELMRVAVDQCVEMRPFSVYLMMCSGIGAYNKTGNAMAAKHWAEVESLPWSDTVKAYLAANLEVEYALRDLLDALERAGIADDTVIVLTSSEYPYALEKNENYANFEDYLAELYGKPVDNCFDRDRSTLIVWSGCLEGKNYKVTTPTSSLDIVPTLSNLFGLDYDSRLLPGRDVFSDGEPLVFWPDGSWKTDRASYNAATGEYAAADGKEPYTDVMDIHDAVQKKLQYCDDVLSVDFFGILLGIETTAEPVFPTEMTMEELEAKLGFGYKLPDESEYSGTIVSKFDDSLGEQGGILLEYSFDGYVVYAMKYKDDGTDAYDTWQTDYAERGSEVIDGVEVRFRGQPTVPDYRGIAYWKQDGYQYILNCETAPGVDIMRLLPLFIEK